MKVKKGQKGSILTQIGLGQPLIYKVDLNLTLMTLNKLTQ